MKNITLIIFFLVSSNLINAQRVAGRGGHNQGFSNNEGEATMPEKLNAVKINLSSLGYKNIAVQYERVLAPKISIACQVRYALPGSLPLTNSLSSAASVTDSVNVLASVKSSGWAITPEFRFYPKHAMKGFYLAPYARVRGLTLEYPVSYTDGNGITQKVDSKGTFTSFGGGLMIGTHFNIGKSISLDWFILGIQYMSTTGTLSSTSTQTLTASEQTSVRDALSTVKTDVNTYAKNFGANMSDFSYSVNANSLSISSKFGMVGVRGFGINFGYRF